MDLGRVCRDYCKNYWSKFHQYVYSRVLNTRGGGGGGRRLLIFRIFSDPPDLLKTPRLLIFRFEEATLTLPQCYVENKKC